MPPHERTIPRIVIAPNASLSVRGAWIFMGLASVSTMGCAAFWTWFGLWPVLPFAGLELAALAWGLWVSVRRGRYREVLSFDDERLRLEVGVAGRGPSTRLDWPRAWTRVWLETEPERRNAPNRLVLGHSGHRVAIGGCLTDEERAVLADRIRVLLRSPNGEVQVAQQMQTTLGDA